MPNLFRKTAVQARIKVSTYNILLKNYCPRRVNNEFQESKKYIGSMGSFLDLKKLGAHDGLG